MQENSYKVLTRWYRVPSKLTKIYPSLSAACWRESGLRGSFLHIWWDCPKLRPFWLDIHAQIKLILDVELPDSPLESLLHFPTIPLGQYRKSILPHLLNAARRLIPIHWKKPQIPTRTEWIGLVDNIMAAEEWMAKCKDKYEKFYSIWATWMHYTGQGKEPAIGSSQIQSPNWSWCLRLFLTDIEVTTNRWLMHRRALISPEQFNMVEYDKRCKISFSFPFLLCSPPPFFPPFYFFWYFYYY